MAFLDESGLSRLWEHISLKLSTKVNKVDGKDLSTNDYTDAEKTKLSGIATGANKTTVDSSLSSSSTNPVQNKVINTALGNKANQSSLDSHTGNTTVHITSAERTNWNAAKTHADSAHAPSNAEVNQNAFSNVKVGTTTIAADTKTDTLEIAGSNVTVTPDATNDKVTIGITKDNVTTALGYTPPTENTWRGIQNNLTSTSTTDSLAAAQGKELKAQVDAKVPNTRKVNGKALSSDITLSASDVGADASGTAQAKADAALASAKSYTDSEIADLINGAPTTLDTLGEIATAMATNEDVVEALETAIGTKANASDLTSHTGNKNNPHGVTLAQLGVTATAAEVNVLDGITATTAELNYVDGVTSNIQTQLNGKAASSHGTHVSYSATAPVMDGTASVGSASTVARSDHKHPTDTSRASKTEFDAHVGNKENPHGVTLAQLGVNATAAELNYVDGVTSAIQTQLNNKLASTTKYAASSSVGGAATSAAKLNTNAGSAVKPVYFANGVPVAGAYSLNADVPADAVFTDTQYVLEYNSDTCEVMFVGMNTVVSAEGIEF